MCVALPESSRNRVPCSPPTESRFRSDLLPTPGQIVRRYLKDPSFRLSPTELVAWRQLDEVRLANDLLPLAIRINNGHRKESHRQRPRQRIGFLEVLELQRSRLVQ